MDNPFLTDSLFTPWSELLPERVEPDITAALEQAQANIDAIIALEEPRTYGNTLLAFEESCQVLGNSWALVSHLVDVNTSPPLREAMNGMLPKVTEFYSKIFLNDGLWQAIKAYALTDDAKALSGIKKRLLDETLEDFKDSGADLEAKQKERLQTIEAELAKLTQKYSENVLDSTNNWELVIDDEAKLAGLPESAREAMREDALAKGYGTAEKPNWRISQQMTSVLPVMKYLDDDGIRKQVWEGGTTIGAKEPFDNTDLIRKILVLREEKAQLIGKDSFPDLITARRMAKSGEQVLKFTDDMHKRVHAAFEKDYEDIELFKAEQSATAQARLEPWETSYWSEKLRKARYDFDEEETRPYFAMPSVTQGLFDITEKLFGVSIEQRSTFFIDQKSGEKVVNEAQGSSKEPVEVWHPEVYFYEMNDADGTTLGSFYADWHPRESKRGGAWMNHPRTGGIKEDGSREPHLGLMCGNMSKPTGGKPALLTHEEVETIFHEFGHLLHHLLGSVEVKSLNGVHVAWDFVELPSQIMENWCWEREALDLFARHYETGATIPEQLFEKMLAARNFQQGAFTMRQLGLGKLDLELHLHPAKYAEGDLDASLAEALADYQYPFKTTPPSIARRFSHLFSSPVGYASGYYSYKWAEVLDADAFSRFMEDGVLNAETGMAFRQCILEKGNSEPPEKLFKDFRGRDPDPEALLRRSGLVA